MGTKFWNKGWKRRKKREKRLLNGCSMFELTNERKKEAKEGIDGYNELVMNKNIKRRSRKKEEKK